MAKRWMRGPTPNLPGTTFAAVDHVPYLLFWYHFVTKLLGFSHLDEVVTGGPTRSFLDGHEATASDGVLTAVDLTFSSASNPFTAGSVGKFLVILDLTNPANCGIHEIATYVGAGQVTIDFYVPGGTFPIAATGLTWWMFDANNASYTPTAFGDHFVVRSPHATHPFEVKFTARSTSGAPHYGGAEIESSPNAGAWDAGGHAWNAGARVLDDVTRLAASRYYDSSPHSRLYATGDTDGSFLLLWTDVNAGGTESAVMFALGDPLESTPARSTNERLIVSGHQSNIAASNTSRAASSVGLGLGAFWEDHGARERPALLASVVEEGGTTDYFARSLAANARTGERDAMAFIWTVDPDGDALRFAPLAKFPTANVVVASAVAVGDATPFDSNDYFHLRDGIVIPWNGLPQA